MTRSGAGASGAGLAAALLPLARRGRETPIVSSISRRRRMSSKSIASSARSMRRSLSRPRRWSRSSSGSRRVWRFAPWDRPATRGRRQRSVCKLLFVAAVAIAGELELPASAPKLYAVSARAADLGGDAIPRDLDLADGAVVEVLFPGAEMLVAGELPQGERSRRSSGGGVDMGGGRMYTIRPLASTSKPLWSKPSPFTKAISTAR